MAYFFRVSQLVIEQFRERNPGFSNERKDRAFPRRITVFQKIIQETYLLLTVFVISDTALNRR